MDIYHWWLIKMVAIQLLCLLGIAWGRLGGGRGSRGTFRETWVLRWEPELSIKLIEASRYGSTVANAGSPLAQR